MRKASRRSEHDAGVLYTKELAEAHIEAFRALLDGRSVPLLVVVSDGFRPDGGARDVLLRSDAVRDTFTSGAILFSGRAEAVAVNVFLKVRRPVRPMKAFTSEADALAWIRSL